MMKNKMIHRKNLLKKIALRSDEQLDRAHTFKQTQEGAAEFKEVLTSVMEPILSFVPVIGEAMGIYQGTKMIIEAKDKWDYIGGGVILALSLVGLKALMPSKSVIINSIKLARQGDVAEAKKLIGVLREAKIGKYIEEIKKTVGNKLNLAGLEEKIATAEQEMQRTATALEEDTARETAQTTNKTEQATKETPHQEAPHAEPKFKQFNSGKVLVNFEGSTELLYKYKEEIDRAGYLLNQKGFGNIWYGKINVVSKLDECPLTAQGVYAYWEDSVELSNKILEKRDPQRIGYALIHEYGHRHWFKFMSEAQRAKFLSLLNVKGVYTGTTKDLAALPGHERFYKMLNFEKGSQGLIQEIEFIDTKSMQSFSTEIEKTIANNNFIKVLRELLPQKTERFITEVYAELEAIKASGFRQDVTKAQKIRDLFSEFFRSFAPGQVEYVNKSVPELAKTNVKPIEAVTGYGTTNDAEAFAEAFAHFVTGGPMNSDQLEFFKAVINQVKTVVNSTNINDIIKLSVNYYMLCKY